MSKKIELVCAYTGEKFLKDKREYDRQVRNGKTLFYKDRESAWLASKEKLTKPFVEKACLNCSKVFSVRDLKKSSNFCCRGCCSSFKWKEFKKTEKYSEFQKKVSEKSKLSASLKPKKKYKCVICDSNFFTRKKTCSKECHAKLVSINSSSNPNCGGETNYKRYIYNDILMDSSWEVDLAKWLDSQNIKWIRDKKVYFTWKDSTGKTKRYHPDFYLTDLDIYLDPKNKFLMEKDKEKLDFVRKEYKVTILAGKTKEIIKELQLLK
jgi:hypothetical protein